MIASARKSFAEGSRGSGAVQAGQQENVISLIMATFSGKSCRSSTR